jgi:hypothetical protein
MFVDTQPQMDHDLPLHALGVAFVDHRQAVANEMLLRSPASLRVGGCTNQLWQRVG